MARFDEEKYAYGIHTLNDTYAELYRSLSLPRSSIRRSVHALNRRFLIGKGFTQLETAPFQFWCVTFDLYNRAASSDPNGPRRLIVVLEELARRHRSIGADHLQLGWRLLRPSDLQQQPLRRPGRQDAELRLCEELAAAGPHRRSLCRARQRRRHLRLTGAVCRGRLGR